MGGGGRERDERMNRVKIERFSEVRNRTVRCDGSRGGTQGESDSRSLFHVALYPVFEVGNMCVYCVEVRITLSLIIAKAH